MGNAFRLSSTTMFDRIDDESNKQPFRIVFLSVEGNKTERQYFECVEQYRHKLGIRNVVHIHPLRRAAKDNLCAPEDVLELLEEFLLVRATDKLPGRLKEIIPNEYSEEFVEQYINGELNANDAATQSFERVLLEIGYDIEYNKFLTEYIGKDDVFGIVIDRDHRSHTVPQMKQVVEKCIEKGYKVYISNPLFELWLLLHLLDIDTLSVEELQNIKDNKRVSDHHTYTSKRVSDIAGHSKSIPEKIFLKHYLPKIDFAIEQAKRLETDVNKLIGDNRCEGEIGTNIFELFELLREEVK